MWASVICKVVFQLRIMIKVLTNLQKLYFKNVLFTSVFVALMIPCNSGDRGRERANFTIPYEVTQEYNVILYSRPGKASYQSNETAYNDVRNRTPVACGQASPDANHTDQGMETVALCSLNLSETTHSLGGLTTTVPTASINPMEDQSRKPIYYSTLFAAVAATLSAIIFTLGVLGNVLVVVVIARTRSMHTTTNCYLLSLAVADSLVLISATLPAIPEPFFRVNEWPYGRVMCSLLIFLQYLGVDSSSLSITAFTIERYIAICHPMKAQTMCTLSRAKRIIAALWVFTILYCSPWLGLTDIIENPVAGSEPILICHFRLERSSYLVLYMIDLILFYVIPLLVASILYILICRILFLSRALRKNDQATSLNSKKRSFNVTGRADSRIQVVRMLVVVVAVFAILWMPYRVVVVYNSFAKKPFVDVWFLMFARTMVYINCAINPVLYNIMSVKFKRAFRNYLSCWHRRQASLPSKNYSEVPIDSWVVRRATASQHLQQLNSNPDKWQNQLNHSHHQGHNHSHDHVNDRHRPQQQLQHGEGYSSVDACSRQALAFSPTAAEQTV